MIEIYATAYPKSGLTWLIHLLSDVFDLTQEDIDTPIGYHGLSGDKGVIRKRHTSYLPELRDKIVIMLHRDPRDVAVSAAFYRDGQPVKKAVEILINSGYEEYISSWFNRASYIVRYEDLHKNPLDELTQIYYTLFNNWPSDIKKIEDAIKRQSFENMQTKLGEHFCRKGIVGDWQNHFTREDGQAINGVLGEFMLDQGYIKDLDWWKKL